jgi:NAD+ diphosphatase
MQQAANDMRASVPQRRGLCNKACMSNSVRPFNPNLFSGNPLDRASEERCNAEWLAARRADPRSQMAALWHGDPLIAGGRVLFLDLAATREFPSDAAFVFLGLDNGRATFAIDASAAQARELAPFAEIGEYKSLRDAAPELSAREAAIIGQARWLIEWHRKHKFCAQCGAPTRMSHGGEKRDCPGCSAEHFPRTDPVAIILAEHDGACLLGRNSKFPPSYFSALAGFVEAAETPEECAVRELREEAGVDIVEIRYQFSQPWPFPASMMMGFIATARDRALRLDQKEIVEARWASLEEIRAILDGEKREDLRLPPRFTIARRLVERWAGRERD